MIAELATSLIVLVTDQPGGANAREVVRSFQTIEPFSRMSGLKFEIVQTTAKKLGCETAPETERFNSDLDAMESIDRLASAIESKEALPASCKDQPPPIRLITCDTPIAQRFLTSIKTKYSANYVIVVKSDPRYGGAGGRFPVITTGSPATMAIHELMHLLGFADEYEYTTDCEADYYCGTTLPDEQTRSPAGYGSIPGDSFNVPLFNARSRYSSNEQARSLHGALISWLNLIPKTTPLIERGKLGSPSSVPVGLFRGVTCDKASRRMDTWRAENTLNIMDKLSVTYIPTAYWQTIETSLGTKIDR
ncbi:MAG TPA: hypothetical protein VM432_06630 [Bdellovibrionales bacterium]|nr:hypothetical protein [Bdellovibrionales bacterium]